MYKIATVDESGKVKIDTSLVPTNIKISRNKVAIKVLELERRCHQLVVQKESIYTDSVNRRLNKLRRMNEIETEQQKGFSLERFHEINTVTAEINVYFTQDEHTVLSEIDKELEASVLERQKLEKRFAEFDNLLQKNSIVHYTED